MAYYGTQVPDMTPADIRDLVQQMAPAAPDGHAARRESERLVPNMLLAGTHCHEQTILSYRGVQCVHRSGLQPNYAGHPTAWQAAFLA